jgi:hypothetical protein
MGKICKHRDTCDHQLPVCALDCFEPPSSTLSADLLAVPMTEPQVIELLRKHGIAVVLGAQYSVRCQYGQLLNVIREIEANNE